MSSTPDLRCVQFVELVTEWMEGALDDSDRSRVEEHVVICSDCAIYLSQLRQTAAELKALDESPPEKTRQRLLAEFRRFHSSASE